MNNRAGKNSRLDRPTLGRLEQGLIFTCAMAEDYSASEVWGITITARCDIAHDKAPILNYLPIVSFRSWVQVDGRLLICSRALKQIASQQRAILEQCGLSPSILKVQAPNVIAETLFAAGEPRIARQRKRFTELAEEYLLVQRVQGGEADVSSLVGAFSGISKQIISELSANTLNGFYFLPEIEPGASADGYVVLLREVRHVPRRLASLVASGLSREQYLEICEHDPSSSARLTFSRSDFAMPVGRLPSPDMEHLVQAFAFLFSRVGVDDWDRDYAAHLWEQCAAT